MARKKVKLQFIENDTARKVTCKKRVKGLMKKTNELGILCDVDLCSIVYTPYSATPFTCPEDQAEVRRILLEYRSRPQTENEQRTLNHEGFLGQSAKRSEEKLQRLQMRNVELRMENLMTDLVFGKPIVQVPYVDIKELVWVIEDRQRTVDRLVQAMEQSEALNQGAGNQMIGGVDAIMGDNVGAPFAAEAGPSNYQHQP
ncbi:agamous-like MADS-box protein AGL80 isoform X1 [Silene latifolia]|uniref:agamous-like MADS-box protein AGL80 isoform X1 n=1 Tax=Silene latifolia TaxID=37657 RepID=UPI003D77BA75